MKMACAELDSLPSPTRTWFSAGSYPRSSPRSLDRVPTSLWIGQRPWTSLRLWPRRSMRLFLRQSTTLSTRSQRGSSRWQVSGHLEPSLMIRRGHVPPYADSHPTAGFRACRPRSLLFWRCCEYHGERYGTSSFLLRVHSTHVPLPRVWGSAPLSSPLSHPSCLRTASLAPRSPPRPRSLSWEQSRTPVSARIWHCASSNCESE